MANLQESKYLEPRILNFEVPPDWNSPSTRTTSSQNPHDLVEAFLKANGAWGLLFRYGWMEYALKTDRQLMSQGMAESQLDNNGLLTLYTRLDSRDFYCNAAFFEGRHVILVYSQDRLKKTSEQRYQLLKPSGLVAIVKPALTHQDSSPQARAVQ